MKKIQFSKRGAALVVALVAAAGVVTGREKPSVEVIEAKTDRPAVVAQTAEVDIDLDKLRREDATESHRDPFGRHSFTPPPPPVAAAAPEAPSVPPLPFKYFGRLTENGKTEVYVMRGDDLITVAAGSKIDNEYRVDRISEESITFTYLPMKQKQSLDLAAVQQQ